MIPTPPRREPNVRGWLELLEDRNRPVGKYTVYLEET
jgi:hypothetical protein